MRHRPQYAYRPAPKGYRDQDFVYMFNSAAVPALAQAIAVGDFILNIALRLDRDAPFVWRGTKVLTDQPGLGDQFRGPDGELLSDDFAPVYQSFFPGGFPIAGFSPVAGEPGIECPTGAVVQLNLANLSAAPIIDPYTVVLLMGVKRWRIEVAL